MRLIDADALIKEITEFRCVNCDRRKGMKKGKMTFVYEIGDVPCRACDVMDMIDALDEAPTVGGWISVKDKLPDKQGVYLVAFKPPFPKVTIAWWATTEFGWYDLEYNFHTDGVSHWMPLPPMPEQEVVGDAD